MIHPELESARSADLKAEADIRCASSWRGSHPFDACPDRSGVRSPRFTLKGTIESWGGASLELPSACGHPIFAALGARCGAASSMQSSRGQSRFGLDSLAAVLDAGRLEGAELDALAGLMAQVSLFRKPAFPLLNADVDTLDFQRVSDLPNAIAPSGAVAYDICAALAARESEIPL